MAAILTPRIISEHPLLGIGIGNYSLQRNNPTLLDGLPPTDAWDLPGLGLIGYAAELGVPTTLLLMWLLWRPVVIALRSGAGPRVAAFGSLQFFVHAMGAQITFIYPWIVSSMVVGYSLTHRRSTLDHQ
jgi:O-antigen ligase